jgi:long-chain acyl-CoA synthetase
LRRAVSVSSGLDPQVARAFRWRYGLSVAQALGVIEVGLPLVNRIDPQGRPESVGAPTAGAEAAIVDGAGRPLPDGEVGELLLHAPGMLSAYLDPPLGREAILRDGWFQTGDLARRDADGLITLVGRRKSVLNVAGHKVFPEEVAAVLERHPAVVRAGVDSRPHPLIGEAVHARLQVVDVSCPPDLETLRAHCRPYLSAYKIPVSIEVVEELEVTSSGKVRHGSSVRNEV